MSEEKKTVRELRIAKTLSAHVRLSGRPDYPDTPEQIAETEAFIKSMAPAREQIIAQEHDPEK